MTVIKTAGKITGAHLTRAEEEALMIEAKKELARIDRQNMNEIDAMVLWVLHQEFGFSQKKLRRFYDAFNPLLDALCERYELGKADGVWLATEKLLDIGVDVAAWNAENKHAGRELGVEGGAQ